MAAARLPDVIIEGREEFIRTKGRQTSSLKCDAQSIAGSVSQRACVYSGARVVLNPITDALHLVHGPIGCASYTWDMRGSLSSGSDLYRLSFSTDLQERDVIFGGERKLAQALDELVPQYHPRLVFVYSTCIVGLIGDDLEAVCRKAADKYGIRVIPVQSSGFSGNKAAGYRAACDALLRLIEPPRGNKAQRRGINFLGDFNLAGEGWIVSDYLKRAGIEVNATLTGDACCDTVRGAAGACLNAVQCAGSMVYLARKLEELYGIPYFRVSFLGVEDTSESLRKIARALDDGRSAERVEDLIAAETARVSPLLRAYREHLAGKKAAIYVGGGFKAISLIRQFKELGIDVVLAGTQNGQPEDYEVIGDLVDDGTVIVDDANPSELERFMLQQGADLLVGGVKERPLAYKLGVAFIDHNHARKQPLSGYVGAVNFAREVYSTVCSPVWKYAR